MSTGECVSRMAHVLFKYLEINIAVLVERCD